MKEGIISLNVRTEWKPYRQLLCKQHKDNLKTQLQELATNDTLIALLPNLHKLACCCLSLPIGTASVERSFSQMKLIKTRLRNSLGELSLSRLMKIAIESPETLFGSDVEEVVTIWNKKGRIILLTCSQSLYMYIYIRIILLLLYMYYCITVLLNYSVLLFTCSVLLLTCSVLLLTCSVLLLTCFVLMPCSVLLYYCIIDLLSVTVYVYI